MYRAPTDSTNGVCARFVSVKLTCCHDPSAPFATLTALGMTGWEEAGRRGQDAPLKRAQRGPLRTAAATKAERTRNTGLKTGHYKKQETDQTKTRTLAQPARMRHPKPLTYEPVGQRPLQRRKGGRRKACGSRPVGRMRIFELVGLVGGGVSTASHGHDENQGNQ